MRANTAVPPGTPDAGRPTVPETQLPDWPITLIATLVIIRAVMLMAALITGQWESPVRSFPAWVSVLQMSLFIGPSLLLLVWGRRSSTRALGTYCLDVACTLAEPLVGGFATPSAPVRFALSIRTDAFQAAVLWFFAAEFPRPAHRGWLRVTFGVGFVLTALLGVLLVALDAYLHAVGRSGGGTLVWLANALAREPQPAGADFFFALQYAALLPLFGLIPLKLRDAPADDRRRLAILLAGVGLAIFPIFLEASLATLVPAYRDVRSSSGVRLLRVLLFTTAIGTLPIVATYAALIQRTLPVTVILRAAIQYVLTRSFVYAALALPFAAVGLVLFFYRERPINEVFSGNLGVTLALAVAAGLALAMSRSYLLRIIDRRFFRQPLDPGATLLALTDSLRHATTIDELSTRTTQAVENTFHPSRLTAALLDGSGHFQSQEPHIGPLREGSALAQLIGASDEPLLVDLSERSALARLGPADRMWLQAVGAALVLPMRGPSAELLGMLALGERRGELPYSQADRRLLTAIGSSCGLALARLRAAAAADDSEGTRGGVPARECIECGLVHHSDAIACRCGAPLQRALVPQQFGSHLRFVRRIGAGAMGVVYEAADLNLRQPRAVKALPTTDPAHIGRVRREARAMAVVAHPNLAVLYGVETWRSASFLVMEYCEAGTLAERLRRGPLPLGQALDLGGRIADALKHLHDRGIVHRDVKPSNIGFTNAQAPKLLDFGLAKLIEPLQPLAHGLTIGGSSTFSELPSTEAAGAIRGTPAYLSPEVLGGAQPSHQDDLWSLAVTMLEACTASNPFKAETPAATAARVLFDEDRTRDLTATLPPLVGELFRQLLDRRPLSRPQSASAFIERINLVRQGVTNG